MSRNVCLDFFLFKILRSGLVGPTGELIQSIINHLADDLNTPGALLEINDWVSQSSDSGTVEEVEQLILVLDALLGLKF